MALGKGKESLVCSARECEAAASQALIWKNPAIHYGRNKTWLACPKHTASLRSYLEDRNFPVQVQEIADYVRVTNSK